MSRLAVVVADIIRERLTQAPDDANGEIRLIFHGPQREILDDVFGELTSDRADNHGVPILLQLPSLPAGQENPAVGSSGLCDDTHLLNLRNSPAQPTFLALVPPGQHSMRSVTSTTDEFGVSASNNGGNVPFEDWWADEFVQHLVSLAIRQAGVSVQQQDEARALIGKAAAAADEMDSRKHERSAVWRLLSRLFSTEPGLHGLAAGGLISLACG